MNKDPNVVEAKIQELSTVKRLLSESTRYELRDSTFGDREIDWAHPILGAIAFAYAGDTYRMSVRYEFIGEVFTFESTDIPTVKELLVLGVKAHIDRNTLTDSDEFGLSL